MVASKGVLSLQWSVPFLSVREPSQFHTAVRAKLLAAVHSGIMLTLRAGLHSKQTTLMTKTMTTMMMTPMTMTTTMMTPMPMAMATTMTTTATTMTHCPYHARVRGRRGFWRLSAR